MRRVFFKSVRVFCGSTSKYLSLVRIQGTMGRRSPFLRDLHLLLFPLIATFTDGLVARTVLTTSFRSYKTLKNSRKHLRLHAPDAHLTINLKLSEIDIDNYDSSHPDFGTFVPIFLLLCFCHSSYHHSNSSSSPIE